MSQIIQAMFQNVSGIEAIKRNLNFINFLTTFIRDSAAKINGHKCHDSEIGAKYEVSSLGLAAHCAAGTNFRLKQVSIYK